MKKYLNIALAILIAVVISGCGGGTTSLNGDIIPPKITLKGANPLILEAGEIFNEPGASAVDDIDGNVAVKLLVV